MLLHGFSAFTVGLLSFFYSFLKYHIVEQKIILRGLSGTLHAPLRRGYFPRCQ